MEQPALKLGKVARDESKLDGRVGAGVHSTCLAIKRQFASLTTAAFSKQKYVLSMQLLTGLEQIDNLSQMFVFYQIVRQSYGHLTLLTSRRGQFSLAEYLLRHKGIYGYARSQVTGTFQVTVRVMSLQGRVPLRNFNRYIMTMVYP